MLAGDGGVVRVLLMTCNFTTLFMNQLCVAFCRIVAGCYYRDSSSFRIKQVNLRTVRERMP